MSIWRSAVRSTSGCQTGQALVLCRIASTIAFVAIVIESRKPRNRIALLHLLDRKAQMHDDRMNIDLSNTDDAQRPPCIFIYQCILLQPSFQPHSTAPHPPPGRIRMSLSSTHQMIHVQRTHKPSMTLTEISNPNQRHGSRQLRLQDINKVLDAFLAVVNSVQKWSTHSNSRSTQTHALEDIGAATHAAVDEDFELRED